MSDIDFRENCGVLGILGHKKAVLNITVGLVHLQHRGSDSFGIVSYDNGVSYTEYYKGCVADSMHKISISGDTAIGHVRYSTSGIAKQSVDQPVCCDLGGDIGKIFISYNGNMSNYDALREDLIEQGCDVKTDMDSELFTHLLSKSDKDDLIDKIRDMLLPIEGAYSLVIMTRDKMIAVCDPHGIRPLVMGKIDDSYIFSSESCVFSVLNADFIRDVDNGELVVIDKSANNSINSMRLFEDIEPSKAKRMCLFEYVYFSRFDSHIHNNPIYTVRKSIGRKMAEIFKINADIVVPVPDSGNVIALGYSEFSKIPYENGLAKNSYMARTFIAPNQFERESRAKMKYSPNINVLKNKNIILIDDSIVRGTTLKHILQLIRGAGVRSVHVCVASPKVIHPCFYGISMPSYEELFAVHHTVEEMQHILNADSINYLDLKDLRAIIDITATKDAKGGYCDACFSGRYLY
ncbi:amidophosphoribosyltransferase [Anaplasmataceae bacterium AB001_6]|nr:amidophosphoribosyltransferase [Anaplasmataceae bacterium AB001_6]